MVNKFELVKIIEEIAPPNTAELWDWSGWIVETEHTEVQKVMLCLTVTADILHQAQAAGCDMIISHHPLFTVPIEFNQGLEIYCAHTNLDKSEIGTTVTLMAKLGFEIRNFYGWSHEFLRFADCDMTFEALLERLKAVSKNIRYTNPKNIAKVHRLAFCAGSGTEFWHEAMEHEADVLVTGDLKYHTAVDSEIAIIDIGHFESETPVLGTLATLLKDSVEVVRAEESSPIVQINS